MKSIKIQTASGNRYQTEWTDMKITAQNMNNTANMCMINTAIDDNDDDDDDDDDDTFIKVSKSVIAVCKH